ncbi:MAG: hypothetical protein IJ896_15255 [Fibrobacter sp.]|nr:hypothetical protein [Fibrobacter sp.]
MTLLITVFAAIIATIFWYRAGAKDEMKISTLCYLYWGASLMWFIDAVFEYAELRAEFFTPTAADMLNDAFLGFSAVALGLVIWLAVVLWKDPKGKWRYIATNH